MFWTPAATETPSGGKATLIGGYKPKTLKTKAGEIAVGVPKTRGIEFYSPPLEKGVRSERALKLAIAEMYVKSISTRKVTDVLQKLCGLDVSSAGEPRDR